MCPGGIGEGSMGEAADRELGQVGGFGVSFTEIRKVCVFDSVSAALKAPAL